jgi:PIN domain nuclease of toxin-antitoxin system
VELTSDPRLGAPAELRRYLFKHCAPSIADTAVSLPATFPADPADRLIYATAIESGSASTDDDLLSTGLVWNLE